MKRSDVPARLAEFGAAFDRIDVRRQVNDVRDACRQLSKEPEEARRNEELIRFVDRERGSAGRVRKSRIRVPRDAGMRRKVVLGVAATMTAVTGGLVVLSHGNTVDSNSCPVEGSDITIDCHWQQYLPDPDEVDAQTIIDSSRNYTDVAPTGDGPWPFAVAGSDIGLKVRSTNVIDGEQLGGIQELHVAWVECREDSGWNPDPSTKGGSTWYRIRWDQRTPSTKFFESAPNADGTAWAYSGYLYPTGHNGEVPWCRP